MKVDRVGEHLKIGLIKSRIKFLIYHPVLIFRFLLSDREVFSDISFRELKIIVNSPKVILEAGAADGVDTKKLASEFKGVELYALEPVKQQFNHLKNKFHQSKNIHLFPYALNAYSGVVDINIGNAGSGLSGMGSSSILEPNLHSLIFPEINFQKKSQVEAIRLDDFYYKYMPQNLPIVLMWLDLQGMEFKIIESTKKFLVNKVKFIQIEASRVELYSGSMLFKDINKLLLSINFKLLLNRVGAISGNALYKNLN